MIGNRWFDLVGLGTSPDPVVIVSGASGPPRVSVDTAVRLGEKAKSYECAVAAGGVCANLSGSRGSVTRLSGVGAFPRHAYNISTTHLATWAEAWAHLSPRALPKAAYSSLSHMS